ncbi:lipoprotein-releasing ABC transporter permease subunit [Gammaproteobacteria bacterium]|nr:lipoprotein-releasing ABC transporter permease subunit [Gammaproteobacteria bacterium]
MRKSLPLFIGKRYASLRAGNQLVGFISTLSVMGLSLGVAILITVLSVMNGFERELQQRILALVPHITISSARNEILLDAAEWENYQNIIDAYPGVQGSAPHLQLQGMVLANGRSQGAIINGIDPVQERSVSIIAEFVESGDYDSLQEGEFNILIGSGLATQLQLSVGDTLSLASTVIPITPLGEFTRQKNFTVSGIFKVGSQLDSNLAIVHMNDAQRLYRLGDKIHGLRVQVNDIFAVNNIIQNLNTQLPINFSYSDWTRDYGNIYENIRFSKTLVGLLLSLLVAVAAFNVVVSLVMVVRDKQGDIAILRTMGAPLASIRNIFLIQGFIIGLIGTGFGLVLGIIFSLTVSDLVAWLEVLLNIQFLSAEVYPVNYLPSQIQIKDLVMVCGIALVLSLLATLYPAYTAASVDPAEALRYE